MLRLVLLFAIIGVARAQIHEGRTLVTATLLADTTVVVPGKAFAVGVLLEMAPGWHTYWEYPGDAGIPTTLKWDLPSGFAAGPIQWPLPLRVVEPGDLEVYAYKGRVLLMTTVVPPPSIEAGSLSLRAKAEWLVCAEICIPGSADLELKLPVGQESRPANAQLFAEFRAQLPAVDAPPAKVGWSRSGRTLEMRVSGLSNATAVDLFPLPAPNQQVDHPRNSPVQDGSASVKVETSGELRGVLVIDEAAGRKGWFVSSAGAAEPAAGPATALWRALLYGFLGGFILNLMPCVLPVISLKIFGFIRQAGDEPGRIWRHGLAFVAGIFAWFLGLGLVIVALKAAGNEVSWAFQFQNAWFNLVITCIVFVFALNLFGVFEVVLPGQAATAFEEVSSGSGYAPSFFQGVFATLLATPCTAPFLGTALGFAFSQPAMVILSMFAAIALGMGAPYLLLSARPGWMKLLPKPGAWMERVKQFMGFPLIATVLWLLSILASQKGVAAVFWTSGFLLCLAIACWVFGAFMGPGARPAARLASLAVILGLLIGGGWFFLGARFEGIVWKPFSKAALDGLLNEGQAVFVDFTADWCLSCKFNERTAIDVPAVREALASKEIVTMKADWTNANPEITAILKSFGRAGVPFYVLYPAGRDRPPIVLPELLTQQIVLDAIEKAR